jgi:acetyl-CoA C-acetyltransferase
VIALSDDVVVIGTARTPFGKFGGTLRDWERPQLAAVAIRAALADASVPAGEVDELALGVNLPGGDRSIARQASLHAGLAVGATSYTVDRACCSALAAIDMAARGIRSADSAIAVAGGVENMSKTPYFLEDMRWGSRLGEVRLTDQLVISCPWTGVPRAVQAADEALAFGIGRKEQDQWALLSQQRWAEATAAGYFKPEITEVPLEADGSLTADECPRPEATAERLAALPVVNGSRTVTAGNAPAMATGATAVVLTTRAEAVRRDQPVRATFRSIAAVSGAPEKIASVPAEAGARALKHAGMKLADMHRIEVNEAFAAVPLVTTKVWAGEDREMLAALRKRTNVNGGAIAVGHPTGATAARLLMTLIYELRRRGGGFGLVTLCGGIGEAHAAVIEVEPS